MVTYLSTHKNVPFDSMFGEKTPKLHNGLLTHQTPVPFCVKSLVLRDLDRFWGVNFWDVALII